MFKLRSGRILESGRWAFILLFWLVEVFIVNDSLLFAEVRRFHDNFFLRWRISFFLFGFLLLRVIPLLIELVFDLRNELLYVSIVGSSQLHS
jgi:hypothetical protein